MKPQAGVFRSTMATCVHTQNTENDEVVALQAKVGNG